VSLLHGHLLKSMGCLWERIVTKTGVERKKEKRRENPKRKRG